MINRRHLLGRALGLGAVVAESKVDTNGFPIIRETGIAGLPVGSWLPDYERALAATMELRLLGIPRSWSLVQSGFHPITPERVVIVPPSPRRLKTIRSSGELDRLKPVIRARRDPLRKNRIGDGVGESKLDLILRLMDNMTTFYHRPDHFERWATTCAAREALGSTGTGCGFALAHQFQTRSCQVDVVNPPVDWWLFLFPGGVDWDSLDERPIYWMIAPVFGRPVPWDLQVYCLISSWSNGGLRLDEHGEADALRAGQRLSQMDRVSAAWTVNACIGRAIRDFTNGKVHSRAND